MQCDILGDPNHGRMIVHCCKRPLLIEQTRHFFKVKNLNHLYRFCIEVWGNIQQHGLSAIYLLLCLFCWRCSIRHNGALNDKYESWISIGSYFLTNYGSASNVATIVFRSKSSREANIFHIHPLFLYEIEKWFRVPLNSHHILFPLLANNLWRSIASWKRLVHSSDQICRQWSVRQKLTLEKCLNCMNLHT